MFSAFLQFYLFFSLLTPALEIKSLQF